MSAFLVSNATVNTLATFAADHGACDDPAAAALILWQSNRAALRYRYDDADSKWPELATLESRFRYERQPITSAAGLALLLQSYTYQATRYPDWEGSAAATILKRLVASAAWDRLPARAGSR
jgi:hypothetical protein